MNNNSKKFLAPFFVAMSMLLVACSSDTIVARPNWQNDPIIDVDGLKDNKLKEIYDAVKNLSETNPNILNKVMFDIAKKQIGSYEELFGFAADNSKKDDILASQEFKDFVDNHPIYKAEDKAYKKGDTEATKVEEKSDLAYEISYNKIVNQFNKIKETIFEKLYNDVIKSADYTNDDKLFQEEYFVLDYLVPNMFIKGKDIKITEYNKDLLVMPKTVDQTWEDCVTDYLNVCTKPSDADLICGFNPTYFYFDITKNEQGEGIKKVEDGYVGRKLLPEIYRSLLVDTYVREQRYSNLGRAQARKVNMIKVTAPDTMESKTINFLQSYVKKQLEGTESQPLDFEYIKDVFVGFINAENYTQETDIEDGLDFGYDPVTVKDAEKGGKPVPLVWQTRTMKDGSLPEGEQDLHDVKVYKGTKLGELLEKYISINNVTITEPTGGETYSSKSFTFELKNISKMTDDQKNFFNELTNNGKRLPEEGLIIKERELRTTDMTTDGWALKEGGFSDLSDEYKTRLFSVDAATIVDNAEKEYVSGDKVRYVNGEAYLTTKNPTDDQSASIVCKDDDRKNFYIVNIQEAANTTKLSAKGTNDNYLQLKATDKLGESNAKMDEIVTNIVQKAASSDTYKKNAEQYYLMISNIVINDDSVYEYFKSQFPDLFK